MTRSDNIKIWFDSVIEKTKELERLKSFDSKVSACIVNGPECGNFLIFEGIEEIAEACEETLHFNDKYMFFDYEGICVRQLRKE